MRSLLPVAGGSLVGGVRGRQSPCRSRIQSRRRQVNSPCAKTQIRWSRSPLRKICRILARGSLHVLCDRCSRHSCRIRFRSLVRFGKTCRSNPIRQFAADYDGDRQSRESCPDTGVLALSRQTIRGLPGVPGEYQSSLFSLRRSSLERFNDNSPSIFESGAAGFSQLHVDVHADVSGCGL